MIKKNLLTAGFLAIFLVANAFAYYPEEKNARNNTLVFNLRPEINLGLSVLSFGMSVESGVIFENNLYLTGELGGGVRYFGGFVNFGYKFVGSPLRLTTLFNVAGVSLGFQQHTLRAYITNTANDSIIDRRLHNRYFNIGGIFHQLQFGRERVIGFTNRFIFGTRRARSYFIDVFDGAWGDLQVRHSTYVNFTYSFGVSIPLTGIIYRRRNRIIYVEGGL